MQNMASTSASAAAAIDRLDLRFTLLEKKELEFKREMDVRTAYLVEFADWKARHVENAGFSKVEQQPVGQDGEALKTAAAAEPVAPGTSAAGSVQREQKKRPAPCAPPHHPLDLQPTPKACTMEQGVMFRDNKSSFQTISELWKAFDDGEDGVERPPCYQRGACPEPVASQPPNHPTTFSFDS